MRNLLTLTIIALLTSGCTAKEDVRKLKVLHDVSSIRRLDNARYALIGDKSLSVFDSRTKNIGPPATVDAWRIGAIQMDPSGNRIVVGIPGGVELWNITNSDVRKSSTVLIPDLKASTPVIIAFYGDKVIIGGDSGLLYVCDRDFSPVFKIANASGTICDFLIMGENLVMLSSHSGVYKLTSVNLQNFKIISTIKINGATSIAYSAEAGIVAFDLYISEVSPQVFDFANGELKPLLSHWLRREKATSLTFSSTGKVALSGQFNYKICEVNGEHIRQMNPFYSAAWISSEDLIYCQGQSVYLTQFGD